jgi:hypothetical protein
MNKYLMLTAAALMATATTTVTNAKGSGSVHLTAHSPGGVSYCDTYTVWWSGANYSDQVCWSCCAVASTSYGMGITSAKKKNKTVAISDNYRGDVDAGFEVDWQFGIPFKNGGVFNAYYTTNGTTVNEYLKGGYYTIGTTPAHPTRISTADALPRRVRR